MVDDPSIWMFNAAEVDEVALSVDVPIIVLDKLPLATNVADMTDVPTQLPTKLVEDMVAEILEVPSICVAAIPLPIIVAEMVDTSVIVADRIPAATMATETAEIPLIVPLIFGIADTVEVLRQVDANNPFAEILALILDTQLNEVAIVAEPINVAETVEILEIVAVNAPSANVVPDTADVPIIVPLMFGTADIVEVSLIVATSNPLAEISADIVEVPTAVAVEPDTVAVAEHVDVPAQVLSNSPLLDMLAKIVEVLFICDNIIPEAIISAVMVDAPFTTAAPANDPRMAA